MTIRRLTRTVTIIFTVLTVLLVLPAAGEDPTELLVPDGTAREAGKPADMSRPVQVYILLGQSNMLGAGKIKGDKEGFLTYAVQKKRGHEAMRRRPGTTRSARGC